MRAPATSWRARSRLILGCGVELSELRGAHAQGSGDLIRRWVAAKLLAEPALGLALAHAPIMDMHRQVDQPALGGDAAPDPWPGNVERRA